MKKIREFAKRVLSASPTLYRAAQWTYHEFKFGLSRMLLRGRYHNLRVIRYSAAQLEAQRALGFRSQFGQDHFVFSTFFDGRRDGCFLDIGCNQPEYLNNTYYFETRQGWRGLAFDPINHYEADWQAQRTATFMPMALGAENTTRSFVEIENKEGWANMMSAFADKARIEDLQYGHRTYDVTVRRASDVLRDAGVTQIDFATIDVEGAEMDVLAGLDLKAHGPHVLLIENNCGLVGDHHIRDHLCSRGYRFHARIWTTDDVFVRAD